METELVALAAAGATALVQQMATDGWTAARDRMVAMSGTVSDGPVIQIGSGNVKH
ncbi:hypothetical protein [Streptomyces niveus]|uniref:hypothetical protein n=1 Tax=Streptomyces niveus TaxID=193462 RepID=UPI0036D3193F